MVSPDAKGFPLADGSSLAEFSTGFEESTLGFSTPFEGLIMLALFTALLGEALAAGVAETPAPSLATALLISKPSWSTAQ